MEDGFHERLGREQREINEEQSTGFLDFDASITVPERVKKWIGGEPETLSTFRNHERKYMREKSQYDEFYWE